MNDEEWSMVAGDVPTWTPPEDEEAPVTIEEARSLLAAWCAIPAGGAIPAAVSDRMMHCTPDFLRLAVEQADRANALDAHIAEIRAAVIAEREAIDYAAERRATGAPCEGIAATLATAHLNALLAIAKETR